MIRPHHILHQQPDIPSVRVRGIHQLGQIPKEGIHVERNRAADVDEVVVGLAQALLVHELLFVELLAGPKTGVLDLDVDVRAVAGQADQVAGQGVDLDRAAHVEDEDLAAVSVSAGQKDQTDGFGDRHEVADDVRVRDLDRTALLDHLAEERDHGAVAAQDVAEADRHELGVDVFEGAAGAVLVGGFRAHMGKELRDLRGLTGFDLRVETLDDHLAEALGGAHDVGRIDRLVRRDEDEALTAVDHGGVSRLVGADGVVLDRLARAVLHEGDVLVRGGVIDDLGAVVLEDLPDAAAVADGSDQGLQRQVRILLTQLVLDVVGVVLVDIEDDQAGRAVSCDLAAEFAADRTAAARDEDGLAVDEVEDFVHVGADGFPAEEVLHGDLLHLAGGDFAGHELVHAREVLQLAVGLLADVQDVAALFSGGAGDCQVDLLDVVFLDVLQDRVAAADDRDAVHDTAPLVGVVVDDAADLVVYLLRGLQVGQDEPARASGADQHDAADIGVSLAAFTHEEDESVGEADADDQDELEQHAHDVVRDGHALHEKGDRGSMKQACEQGGLYHTYQFRVAGVAPDAVIEPEPEEDDEAEDCVERCELEPGVKILRADVGELAVEPEPECQKIREVHGDNVIRREDHRDALPVLHAAGALVLVGRGRERGLVLRRLHGTVLLKLVFRVWICHFVCSLQ